MAENLLDYYERELTFLRRMGSAFARKYPKIAQRLMLEPDKCDDPHVERVLEGVAFLAARVHSKLDEEFPQIAGAFLDTVAPHYLLPVPSLSIAQVHAKPEQWLDLPAGTLLHTRLIRPYDTRCRFRTCFAVQSWPVVVNEVNVASPGALKLPAELQASWLLQLRLRCTQGRFSDLKPPTERSALRIYLDGPRQFALYEQLAAAALVRRGPQAFVRGADGGLCPISLHAVGFEPGESLLPYSCRSFFGYRILQEYFAFPKKFLFLELRGLDAKLRARLGELAEVIIVGCGPVPTFTPHIDDFKLGCTPIINLFPQPAEPITVSHTQAEYRVTPDARHPDTTEVYSVDTVSASSVASSEVIEYLPLYGLKGGAQRTAAGRPGAFFQTSRRVGENGSEVYVSLVDLGMSVHTPGRDTLLVHTTCTNRELAGRLPLGSARRPRVPAQPKDPATPPEKDRTRGTERQTRICDEYDLTTDGDFLPAAALVDKVAHIDCLERPTPPTSLPMGRGVLWRLVSHLNLNHLSIVDRGQGLAALKEMLQLYDLASGATNAVQISGLVDLESERTVARARDGLPGFCRGVSITLRLSEERFVGGSAFLFAAVLETFFSQYVSLNSFTQLTALSDQGRELGRWPPRIGSKDPL
ncbi:MAG: type VI secretion system baseplate subunit TssF [Polyangia bacterium]